MDIAQPNVAQRLQLPPDLGDVLEHTADLLDRGVQQVGDGVSLELDFERLVIVAPRAADVARDVNVRQEIHLDALLPVSLARLATSALNVEAEAARPVAP